MYASRNATPGYFLATILIQVILQLEQGGVRIIGFTSDGSQSNKKAWVNLGSCGKRGKIKCSIPNLADENRRIWALSDAVHIIKYVRKFFCDKVSVMYNNIVSYEFFRLVYKLDTSAEDTGLRTCPKVTAAHL